MTLKIHPECDDLKVQCSNLTQQLEESGVRLELAKYGDKKSSSATESSSNAETDMRQLQAELASVKDLLREQMEKYDKQLEENERLSSETAELRSLLDDATLQLESLKENVMSLEMADFEKTVERLQKELKVAADEKQSMRTELQASMKDLESSREENARLTHNITKLKAALRKVRSEIEGKF
ncbi:unnamed protein product [Gongylonema pulchrum]|uniref:Leucine zipper transcription factor-like protein 1 n=1 Tax=Gongylonema pulchrum TaxID=637853 RepID=A0A183EU66_9BILA|nr:unnamed protein product [Gongylonema pulchrum]